MSKKYLLILIATLSLVAGAAASEKYRVFSFCTSDPTCSDGAFPYATVTVGPGGVVYGTTEGGGGSSCDSGGCGTVFRFDASGEQVIHVFGETFGDGVFPEAALAFDQQGNIYGTTQGGGNSSCAPNGCGTVFELKPSGNGEWTEQILYSFCSIANCPDGANPQSSLTFDAAGNIYGTTTAGGPLSPKRCDVAGCGTVFELVKGENDTWTEKVLFQFDFKTGDFPSGSVALDAAGHLYGTANSGGTSGYGVVFRLSPTSEGFWNEKNIVSFDRDNGSAPFEGVVIDKQGNLYGTTYFGGASSYCYSQSALGCGEVFELSPGQNGTWNELILYSFCSSGTCPDGSAPWSGLVMDASGNLYGTTNGGGEFLGGTVFKLTRGTTVPWEETVLHSFGSVDNDGSGPQGGVIFNPSHTALYGTTAGGGSSLNCDFGHGCGTVFEVAQ